VPRGDSICPVRAADSWNPSMPGSYPSVTRLPSITGHLSFRLAPCPVGFPSGPLRPVGGSGPDCSAGAPGASPVLCLGPASPRASSGDALEAVGCASRTGDSPEPDPVQGYPPGDHQHGGPLLPVRTVEGWGWLSQVAFLLIKRECSLSIPRCFNSPLAITETAKGPSAHNPLLKTRRSGRHSDSPAHPFLGLVVAASHQIVQIRFNF